MILQHIKQIIVTLFIFMSVLANAQIKNKYEYGIKTSLNYPTIGTSYSKYTGNGQFSIGAFATYRVSQRALLALEPTYSTNSFRETQSDIRYRYNYLDVNVNTYFDLFRNETIWLYIGLRPGFLSSYRTDIFKTGSFERIDTPYNKNSDGQIDLGINVGLSVRVSPIVNFELGYVWSVTNQTNASQVKGRPSLLEVSLKLNAVDLKNIIEQRDLSIKDQVRNYQKGNLFVMLPTINQKSIQQLNANDLDYIKQELDSRNKKVMEHFKANYTFTPVYFFMDTSAYKIISGDFSGIFVNPAMQVDTLIVPASNHYFIASFCHDLSEHNQKISYGLFIYDSKMTQLGKPFNIPSQIFGLFADGDPISYFRTKRPTLVYLPFDKHIKKFNARMLKYASEN